MPLTLKRKPLFSGFEGPGSALMRSLCQVWIQRVFLIGFNVVFCDLGIICAPFWSPLGLLFRVVFRLCLG